MKSGPSTGRAKGSLKPRGRTGQYSAKRVLLATGLTHLPPDIPGVTECLGKSLFFCKDCDAFRVQGKRIVISGHQNEAADYALAMLAYSPNVSLQRMEPRLVGTPITRPGWRNMAPRFGRSASVPWIIVDGTLRAFLFEEGPELVVDAAFTNRGDVCHSRLAEEAGAALDSLGQVIVDQDLRTSVRGLYAAGCVTPANCQMIIAAGQGAIAAQAINRDLFEESLRQHFLPCCESPIPETLV